jgi:transposase
MLSLSLPGRVFLCTLPTDMRKSFDSLAGLVEQQLGQDPLAGGNRRAKRPHPPG